MKKLILGIALAVLFIAPMVFVSHPVHSQETTEWVIDTDATLYLPLDENPSTLNPVIDSRAYDLAITGLIFDGFQTANPLDYTNLEADINWLAESITSNVTENGTVYWIVKLRDGVKFFDGTPLTADDVVFTYQFILWLGPDNDLFYDIPLVVTNVTKIDDLTVRIDTNVEGIVAAEWALGIWVFPKHIYELASTWDLPGDNVTYSGTFPDWNVTHDAISNYVVQSPNDPVLTGYGPFKLVAWYPADQPVYQANTYVLERNPYYFMRAVDENGNIVHEWKDWSEMTPETVELYGPYVKYIQYTVLTDPAAKKDALINGEIDMAEDLDFGVYVREFLENGFTIAMADRLGFGHTLLNTKSESPGVLMGANSSLMNISAFRRAIAYAFDKQYICDNVWDGWAVPLDIPVPKSMGDWSIEYTGEAPGNYYTHDKDAALAELSAIGIKDYDNDSWLEWNASDPNSEITVRLRGTDVPSVHEIVEPLAADLEDIGIHVSVEYFDWSQFLDVLFSRDFDLIFFGFGLGRIPTFLQGFTSSGIYAYIAQWSNATFDELINQAFFVERNWTRIKELVKQAEIIYWYELPLIPIYQNTIVGAYKAFDPENAPGGIKGVISILGAPVDNWFNVMRVVKFKQTTVTGGTGGEEGGVAPPTGGEEGAEEAAEEEGGGVNIGLIVGAIVVVVVLAILAALFMKKRAE